MKSSNNGIKFLDLNTIGWLFEGDSSLDPQYQVYKNMRASIKSGSWEVFNPYSNILWLHFVLDRLLSGIKRPSALSKDLALYTQLTELKERLKIYKSAAEAKSLDHLFFLE